jgi:hypothetical protein
VTRRSFVQLLGAAAVAWTLVPHTATPEFDPIAYKGEWSWGQIDDFCNNFNDKLRAATHLAWEQVYVDEYLKLAT